MHTPQAIEAFLRHHVYTLLHLVLLAQSAFSIKAFICCCGGPSLIMKTNCPMPPSGLMRVWLVRFTDSWSASQNRVWGIVSTPVSTPLHAKSSKSPPSLTAVIICNHIHCRLPPEHFERLATQRLQVGSKGQTER